uniref:Putative salivary secreted peptide n=1 Tax=Ixodes scapularis TaxID=6945 RepID=A0A4D5RPD6_IXOSC
MASPVSCLFAVALLLVLVHQHAAGKIDTFDLEKEVERSVQRRAKELNMELVWWDVHGNHDEIKRLHFQGPPVTATAGPVVYGAPKSSAMRPNVVYTQWVHNGQANSSQTTTIARSTQHKKTATWHVESGFSYSGSVTASASLFIVNIKTTHQISLDLKGGYRKEVSDTDTFSVNHVVTVPPMKSVKIDWIITDSVQEVPWTSTVTLTGYIHTKWKEELKLLYHDYRYCTLGSLRDSRLKHAGNSTFLYTSKGTFTGVKGHEAHLRIKEYDYQPYGGRSSPVRAYNIP